MREDGREKDGKYIKGRKNTPQEREKIAKGLQGNSNKLRLKTEEQQKAAYESYCQWIAAGRGRQGFVFECEDDKSGKTITITWQTMENYLINNRFNLDPLQKEKAECLAYQTWENAGIEMMQGKVEKCQPAIYQMMMRNKFGWDKEQKITHSHETDARKFLRFCEQTTPRGEDEKCDA